MEETHEAGSPWWYQCRKSVSKLIRQSRDPMMMAMVTTERERERQRVNALQLRRTKQPSLEAFSTVFKVTKSSRVPPPTWEKPQSAMHGPGFVFGRLPARGLWTHTAAQRRQELPSTLRIASASELQSG